MMAPSQTAAARTRAPGAPSQTNQDAGPEPTPEEVVSMLEEIQRMGGQLNPEMQAILQQLKAGGGLGGPQGNAAADMPTEEITPEPGFVVKTTDVGGRKVFLNMVGHPRVAAPGSNWSGGVVPDEVQKALENADNLTEAEADTLRFPLSMTPPRSDLDKKGEVATVYDCCLNSDVINMCGQHRPLKIFIIELAMKWVSHKHKQELDPKYKLPKMRYKGDTVETHRIRTDKKPLVTEIKEIDEDPVFPLVTKKPPPGKLPTTTITTTSATQSSTNTAPSTHKPTTAAPATCTTTATNQHDTAGPASTQSASGFTFSRGSGQAFRQLGQPQLVGRPVDAVTVEIEVPDRVARDIKQAESGSGGGGGYGGVLDSVRVDVAGQRVWVSAPGCQELEVALPLAVSAQGASVSLDPTRTPFPALTLHLPYLSVLDYVREAQAHAPHAPGSLAFSSTATALELEA